LKNNINVNTDAYIQLEIIRNTIERLKGKRNKRVMGAQHRYFQAEFKKLDKWFGKYQEIEGEYFALKKE